MGKNAYWTTSDGDKVSYSHMGDAHLKNIIKDGYRNPYIRKEAFKRGFSIPDRAIDKLSPKELLLQSSLFLESCSSCAIEGNELGKKILTIYKTDHEAFLLSLNAYIDKLDQQEKAILN